MILQKRLMDEIYEVKRLRRLPRYLLKPNTVKGLELANLRRADNFYGSCY